MERIRRISAFFVALSLVLPQRSCMNDGQLEIHYPLSHTDSWLAFAVIVALFTLPLLVLLLSRARLASMLLGGAAAGAGLYLIAYGSAMVGTHLLIGWYTYTLGALAYLGSTLALLGRELWSGPASSDRRNTP
jgi:hypothetical protein